MTAVPGRPEATAPIPGTRREVVQRDEHASIVKSLTRVDWLVLLEIGRAHV